MHDIPNHPRFQIGGNRPPMSSADRQFYRNINCLLPPHDARIMVTAFCEVDAAKEALQKALGPFVDR